MPESKPTLITSAQNPRVKELVRLSEQRHRRERGLFVAEGWRAVERALRAGLILIELYECRELPGWMPRDADHIDELITQSLATSESRSERDALAGAPARFALTPTLMEKAAYCENPQGVLGVFVQPAMDLAALEQRLTTARPRRDENKTSGAAPPRDRGATGRSDRSIDGVEPDLFLIVVGAEKPGNIGAMMRTADAAGVTAMIVADPVVDLFNPNVIRASTGAVFALPTATGDAAAVRQWLRQRGVAMWAAAPPLPGRHSLEYTRIDWRRPSAIVIGPEDTGLDGTWLDADFLKAHHGGLVTIPMQGDTADSLNASVAAAVLLFEARRQRGSVPSPPGRGLG